MLITNAHAVPTYPQSPLLPYDDTLANVAEQAVKSVVSIHSTMLRQHPLDFFGFRSAPVEQTAGGSGVIISKEGIILTNNHVVADAKNIKVTIYTGHTFQAEVIGTDTNNDIAVLKLKGKLTNLIPIKIDNSDNLRLCEFVLAVGNPFDIGQTVTLGIISAKDRLRDGFIQTDAAINRGNSGGALVNMDGKLVGINTMILSRSGGSVGIGFAIPSNTAKPIMESIVKHGKVITPWLGVTIQTITPELADAMKLSSELGVLLSDVLDDTPAKKAGLKRDDIVIEINNKPITTGHQLQRAVRNAGVDNRINVKILRKGKKITKTIKLAAMPDSKNEHSQKTVDKEDTSLLRGVLVTALDSKSRSKYQISKRLKHGVVVTKIMPRSPALSIGLVPGDVIVELNRKPLKSLDSYHKLKRKTDRRIVLRVYRQGAHLYLVLSR